MAAILDFTEFNFSTEEIRAVRELVFDEIIEAPEIDLLHTIYPGIVYDREIGFIGKGGLVGVAGQGCDPEPQGWNIGTRVVKWEPKSWEILIGQCAKDLEATAAIYSLKTGVDYFDFTSSDYINIVVEVLSQSIKEFVIRLVWFSDTDAENIVVTKVPTAAITEQTADSAISGTVYEKVTAATEGAVKCALSNKTVVYLSATAATGNAVAGKEYYTKDTTNKITLISGGQISEGVDTDYFTILDGLWKQIEVQLTVNANQRVTITENAGLTYGAQAMDKTNIQGYLENLVFGADLSLRNNANGKIFCTQSFYDAYAKSLAGTSLESMFTILQNGIRTLTYNGIPLLPIPTWDIIIRSYYDNGTTLVSPNRALYTTKDILAVGVDAESSFGDMDVWYNKDTRTVKIECMGKADAKLINPLMFQVAI